MQFIKLKAEIPSCCRIAFQVPDLDAESHIARLPEEADNSNIANARRHKWILRMPAKGDLPLLQEWPQMRDFLDGFPGECVFAHVALMKPGAVLSIHRDGYDPQGAIMKHHDIFNSTLRFHVPLRTSDKVHFFSDGLLYNMGEGELWMIDNMKLHAVKNDDESVDRYHLIFDVRPDADTMALLHDAETQLGRVDPASVAAYWPEDAHLAKAAA